LKDGQRKGNNNIYIKNKHDLNDPGNLFDDEYPVVVAEGLPLVLPQLEPDGLHHVHVLTIGSTNHNTWSSVTFPEVSVTVTIIALEHALLGLVSCDADPDPSDPYVFGPPGSVSGSISQSHGSGSFYLQAKIVRKTLILPVLLLLFDFLFLKNDVNVPSKSNKQKTFFLN
jgi:hypothetical protein